MLKKLYDIQAGSIIQMKMRSGEVCVVNVIYNQGAHIRTRITDSRGYKKLKAFDVDHVKRIMDGNDLEIES